VAGPPRVLCVGGAVLDRRLTLLAPAVPGTSNPARSRTDHGGVARNVAENLARLGFTVGLVSRVGDDEAGRDLLARLRCVGVDVAGVAVVARAVTAQYVAVLGPDGELVLGAAAMDVLDDVDPAGRADSRAGADWVFADANLAPRALAGLLDAARRGGAAALAVDAVSVPKVARLPADLRGVDTFFGNVEEGRAWLRAHGRAVPGDPLDVAVETVRLGARRVVMTLGRDGAVAADSAGAFGVAAVRVEPVDVTGAGDAAVAGTLAALAQGWPLAGAVGRGMLLAALTVQSPDTVRQDLTPALLSAAAPLDEEAP
jgi:pseudouridine kinase